MAEETERGEPRTCGTGNPAAAGEPADAPEDAALRIERRDGGVAIVWFDVPGEKVNTLQAGFDREFHRVLRTLDRDDDLEAVVLASGKDDTFIAGADVELLRDVESAEEATRLSRTGQMVMNQLETFRLPIVAAIHGDCFGGGLEVAMACAGRVASRDDDTLLGQLEVRMGVIPGAGGTQRLPRIVGLEEAISLILSGKKIDVDRALELGLVDEAVPRSVLIEAAIEHSRHLAREREEGEALGERIRELLGGALDPKALRALLLEDNPVGRGVLFSQARKRTLSRTKGHYPAPLRALEVIRTGVEEGIEAGYEAEAEAFGEMVASPEATRLMELFFARNELKKDPGVDDPDVEAREVEKVGVLGAGLMGSGIAYVTAAKAGLPVRLKDKDHEGVRGGLRSIRSILDGRIGKGRIDEREAERTMARVHPTIRTSGFGRADVVIEAVFEDLGLKQRMVREVEEAGSDDVIFASNTSSLPITEIAEASDHPETVIGMHYFSPVQKMPLLEIIVTEETAPEVTATCVRLGKDQGKTVIVVRDGPGFYTSRIIGPYGNEAAHLVSEGVPVEGIDDALVEFGFPVGPVKLLDEVGIDVAHKVGGILLDAFGERMAPPEGLEALIDDERYGRKNGRGFYRYEDDEAQGVDPSVYEVLGVEPTSEVDPETIAERCVLQMVNEAAHCHGEGILRSARDGDVGAVFGLGFPPFRGGPLRWVDTEGPAGIVERLVALRDEHGMRFEPAPVLRALADRDATFHGEAAPEPGEFARAERSAVPKT